MTTVAEQTRDEQGTESARVHSSHHSNIERITMKTLLVAVITTGLAFAYSSRCPAQAGYETVSANVTTTKASPASSFLMDFGDLGRTMPGPATSAMWPVSDELSQSKQVIAHTKADKSSVSQGGQAPDTASPGIGHFLTKRR
jgi:hypothetical protein